MAGIVPAGEAQNVPKATRPPPPPTGRETKSLGHTEPNCWEERTRQPRTQMRGRQRVAAAFSACGPVMG